MLLKGCNGSAIVPETDFIDRREGRTKYNNVNLIGQNETAISSAIVLCANFLTFESEK